MESGRVGGGKRGGFRVTFQEANKTKKTSLRDSDGDSLVSQQHWTQTAWENWERDTACAFSVPGVVLDSCPPAVSGESSTYFQRLPSGWNQDGSSHHFPHLTSRTWCKENTRAWEFHTGLKAKHRYESSSAAFQHS